MSYFQRFASFISRDWGSTRKTLVITDLTYMWADVVCVAGLDEEGHCVRPITPDGVRQHHLFRQGCLVVYPRAKVEFVLSPAEITPPHIEDYRFELGSIVNKGTCSDWEWEAILRSSSFPSVEEMFDGYLEDDRRVPPRAQTRSLGTIGHVRIHGVSIDDSHDRRQFRLDFEDASGRRFNRFPVNDLAFRMAIQKGIDALEDEREAEYAMCRALERRERVYLRIGLARPQTLGDHPECCWTHVTGIYTFPDYLGGRTFAEF